MKYIAAYLLTSISNSNLAPEILAGNILDLAGVDYEASKLHQLFEQIGNRTPADLTKEGAAKLAMVCGGAAAGASTTAAAEKPAQEEKKEEEEAAAPLGLDDMFGDW